MVHKRRSDEQRPARVVRDLDEPAYWEIPGRAATAVSPLDTEYHQAVWKNVSVETPAYHSTLLAGRKNA